MKILNLIKDRKYFKIFSIFFLLYFLSSLYLIYYFYNGFYLFFNNPTKYYPWASLLFTLILSLLFGINISLVISKFYEIKNSKIGIIAGFISLFSAGCPVCSLSLISLLIPGLSLTFTLAALPFKGLEIQFFTIILLAISIKILTKNNICKTT